jgi:PAS domain S-box-containing protein/putative nucleotidyltransferase with HDIG domain
LRDEVLEILPDVVLVVDSTGTVVFANERIECLGYTPGDLVGQSLTLLIPERYRASHAEHVARYHAGPWTRRLGTQTGFRARHRAGHLVHVDIQLSPHTIDDSVHTLCIIRDLTAQKELEAQLSKSDEQYRHMVEHASDVFYRVAVDDDPLQGRVAYVSPQAETLTGYPGDEFLRDQGLWMRLVHPSDVPVVATATRAILDSRSPGTREYRIRHRDDGHYAWVEDRVVPQYDTSGTLVGYQGTARDITERWWLHHQLRTIVTLGGALRDRRGREEIITALLDALPPLFEANGVAFVSRNASQDTVTFELARGALAAWTARTLPTAEALSGRVIASGSAFVANSARTNSRLSQHLPDDVHAYASVPVRTVEATVGALVVTKAVPFIKRELTVLEAVGELAAIALQRQQLHEQVQRKALDIEAAYESTIAGWARALDMRDRITKGHTQRVTELALQLAEALGVPEDQLPHLRRGGMLHDIGKMAIPDAILQKAGPLTPDERAIMQKHAEYAGEMLGPIEFLQPALDVPLSHHERWDGKGYPRGLKGEEIPLLARIFAVADVYDAITSERPYAAAEPHEAAIAFITAHSGRQFDPAVVAALQDLEAPLGH